jgi:hypothetical protein
MLVTQDSSFYFERLYPLQNEVLRLIGALDTGFYLSGGTAASRGYLQHRFSDDLDLFVNDDDRFELWSARILQALVAQPTWQVIVMLREARFVRVTVARSDVTLKIELINDVPAHTGAIWQHPELGRLDSAENILANKISAVVDREEPKDLADIWGFCCRLGLSVANAIDNASSKAAGIFVLDIARILATVTAADWQLVRWIDPPPPEQFVAELRTLGESLVLGGQGESAELTTTGSKNQPAQQKRRQIRHQ